MPENIDIKEKVNIYYPGFKHRVGGAYIHVVNFSKGLEELGYDVRVITLDSLPLILRYIPHLVQKAGNIINFPFGFVYKGKTIRFFYKLFFQNSSDIEVFEDIYIYWNTKKRSIVFMHAPWSDNLQAFNVDEQQRVELEKEEAKIINNMDTNIVTVSEPYKDFMVSRLEPVGLKKKIDVIELGVDVNKFLPNDKLHKYSIIFVGLLEVRKNIKFLLEVFKKLHMSDERYTLTIVGDGPQKKELMTFVDDEQIKNVDFLGRLGYDEVLQELPKHHYYMHTSTKESFSYSLLEAKLSGLITIAHSGLEVPSEFIDIKVDKFDINEWVDKIDHYEPLETVFDKNKFSYQIMTKNILDKIV